MNKYNIIQINMNNYIINKTPRTWNPTNKTKYNKLKSLKEASKSSKMLHRK